MKKNILKIYYDRLPDDVVSDDELLIEALKAKHMMAMKFKDISEIKYRPYVVILPEGDHDSWIDSRSGFEDVKDAIAEYGIENLIFVYDWPK